MYISKRPLGETMLVQGAGCEESPASFQACIKGWKARRDEALHSRA